MNELDIYKSQGFGAHSGFGARPALLIVDFVNSFTDPAQFGGGNICEAIENTKVLLAKARDVQIPIAFTRVVYADDGSNAGIFCLKSPGLKTLTETANASQIVIELKPNEGEFIVRKTEPSAFFGTNLGPWLVHRQVDTVLVTGCTTSGCVRASVVDAMSNNFHVIVASDCVGDRALAPHNANLFDMEQKYADLMTSVEITAALDNMQPLSASAERAKPHNH